MIIYNKFIPFKAINFFGIIFAREQLNEIDINHEKIHTAQMKDLLFIGFYIWYLIEWIWNLFEYRNFIEAYKHISFEKSDMYPILKEWFPEEKDLRDKIIELTINWLNDEDYPDHKIWNYFK